MEFYTYWLFYDCEDGYTAHRFYNTNDMIGTAKKAVNDVVVTFTTGAPPFIHNLKELL